MLCFCYFLPFSSQLREMGHEIDVLSEHAFAQHFDVAVNTTNKRNDVLKVSAIVEEIGKGKAWVGANVYGALVFKLLFFGLDKRAVKLFHEEKHLFDSDWQNVVVQQIAKRKSLRGQTDALVKDMHDAGISLEAGTYSALIRMCLRDGEVQKCVSIMEEAHHNKLDLEVEVYDALISALAKVGDHEAANKAVVEMSKSVVGLTPTALLVLLRQTIMDKDTQSCADVLSELREMNNLGASNLAYITKEHHNLPELIQLLQRNNKMELVAELTSVNERVEIEPILGKEETPKDQTTEKHAEFGPPSLLQSFEEVFNMRRSQARFMDCYEALCAVLPMQAVITQLADEVQRADVKIFHAKILQCAILAKDFDACTALLKYAADKYHGIYISAMSPLKGLLVSDFNAVRFFVFIFNTILYVFIALVFLHYL